MDRRKHYFLVLDTETANSLEDPLVYDMGWAIVELEYNSQNLMARYCRL